MRPLIRHIAVARLLLVAFAASWPVRARAAQAKPTAFNVRLGLVVAKQARAAKPAHLILSTGRPDALLVVEIARDHLRVALGSKTKQTALWEHKAALAPARHALMLKQRSSGLAICLDGLELTRLPAQVTGRPKAKFEPGAGITADGKPRVQFAGPIWFSDDFARAPHDSLQWETKSGRFAINGSLNPGSSQSAFQLWGGAPNGPGLAVSENSYWFWDDYQVGVSANCARLPATWGLVFHYVNAQNYHMLKLSQPEHGAGLASLIRRRKGKDCVLAKRAFAMRPDQWYRAAVVTFGTLARAFVNGTEVGSARDPALVGGRVGLFIEKTAAAYFDDVEVRSVASEVAKPDWTPSRPFGPSERQWSDFAKKSFFTDRYMVQWAHPRSFWQGNGRAGMAWFRTRFFHDVAFAWERNGAACRWPAKPAQVVLFGKAGDAHSGYRLRLEGKRAVLSKCGRVVAQKAFEADRLSALKFSANAGQVSCRVNGKPLLQWCDAKPLTQGWVGADMGRMNGMQLRWSDWRDRARVTSAHRLDYSFNHAPAAWDARCGEWRGTHRWACVPRWSFFSGRGVAGAPGIEHANVELWNLRRFKGDFDLELFVAPMEGTPQRIHFTWPVSLNVAFAADGRHFDSGYMLHFGTYDAPSRLFRAGREMAVWPKRVMPDLRLRAGELYHRVTQVWQQVRIQRRGKRILIDVGKHDSSGYYVGLENAFDVTDPKPLTGDRIGLWTWGNNGMAIARATISYADSPGVASLRGASQGRRVGDVAVARLTEAKGRSFHRITNLCSGGSFTYDLLEHPLDLSQTGALQFDYRLSPGLALSLLASVRGQTAEVVVCGDAHYRPTTIPLGRLAEKAPAPGQWHHAQFDFRSALRRAFPTGALVIDRLVLASPYETLAEIAGLGVNREGAHYDVANVKWTRSPTPKPAVSARRLDVLVHGTDPVDDFERGADGWATLGGVDGAALYRDSHDPAAGQFSLRLLNQRMGGPAGAWVTRQPYDLSWFPRLAFEYRMPAGIEVNLLVRANGRRFEVMATGTDSTWPVVGSLAGFKADGKWHRAEFDLYAALQRRLGTSRIRVDALAWADSCRMSSRQRTAYWFDDFCRVPAIDAKRPTVFTLRASEPVVAFSHVVDNKPTTCPAAKATGQGDHLTLVGRPRGRFLHVRGRTAKRGWTEPRHVPIVAGAFALMAPQPKAKPVAPAAPPAPFVSYIPSDRLCRTDFEFGRSPEHPEGQMGEACIRRAAWVLPCADDAATGRGCAEFVNLYRGDFFSAYFRRSAWNPERWPRVAFDYKFEQAGCALNLSMLVNEGMTIVEWTGPNRRGNYFYSSIVGRTDWAKQDGHWHHAEFDLLDMLLHKRFPDPKLRGEIAVTELSTWATSHTRGRSYRNPVGARLKIDNFTLFSPRGRRPAFEWRVHWPGKLKGYSYAFDHNAKTVPPAKVLTTAPHAQFSNVKPGTWHFHVRGCGADGQWGATAHCQVEIKP